MTQGGGRGITVTKRRAERINGEYNFTKNKYVLKEITELNNRKTFSARCIIEDQK